MNFTKTIFAVAIFVALITKNSEAERNRKSGLSILGLEDSREYILPEDDGLDLEDSSTNVGGAVLLTIKNQFKAIIEELFLQSLQYVSDMIQKFKTNLLQKLSAYTLKDVFSAVFDGIADFVVEQPEDDSYYRYKTVEQKRKFSVSEIDPSMFDGYGLAALFRSKRTF